MKNLNAILCGVMLCSFLHSQVPAGIWQPNEAKRPVPLPAVREADIACAKRIWRVIDLREKLNHRLYYPSYQTNRYTSLYDVLKNAAFKKQISVYSPNDDEFSIKYTPEVLKERLIKNDTVSFFEIDDFGNEKEVRVATNDTIDASDIIQYWVKEDWFFDTKRSVLDVRIIGICPVKYDADKDMMIPIFWVYFDECRPLLAANKIMTAGNDALQLTYDDLFLKRMFSSFIYKESNVYDRSIAQYLQGSEMLLEAEKIKEGIYNFESDLWHR